MHNKGQEAKFCSGFVSGGTVADVDLQHFPRGKQTNRTEHEHAHRPTEQNSPAEPIISHKQKHIEIRCFLSLKNTPLPLLTESASDEVLSWSVVGAGLRTPSVKHHSVFTCMQIRSSTRRLVVRVTAHGLRDHQTCQYQNQKKYV